MIFIIIGIIIVLILSLVYISIKAKYKKIKDRFNDTSTTGGILIHMLTYDQLKNMLNNEINISLMTDCGPPDKPTCSAWTLLRKDLAPMPFIYPGLHTTLGILVDTKKIWNLITTMSIIDSDTNNRSCCVNGSGSSTLTKWPKSHYNDNLTNTCTTKILNNNKYDNWVAYIEKDDKGANCPPECKDEDIYCKYMNTYINQQLCTNSDSCYNFEETPNPPNDIKSMFTNPSPEGYLKQTVKDSCTICTKPYLCVTDNSPDNNNIIEEKDRIAAYVGKNGNKFEKLYYNDDILGGAYNTGRLAGYQCKFERKNWDIWVNTVHNYYKILLSLMNRDNSIRLDNYKFLNADPYASSYIENEVNMYVNPDKNSDEYKKQNKIFMDSILGFIYIDSTCEKQLEALDKIPVGQFTNNVDRCDAFFNMKQSDRVNMEQKEIIDNNKLVIDMVSWFNKQYKKKIHGYALNATSNAFPNYKTLSKALDSNIKFDDVFRKL